MGTVRWAIKEDGRLWLHAPYNAAFVAGLRDTIPADARDWDKVRRVWKIARAHQADLRTLVQIHYGERLGEPEDRTGDRAHEGAKFTDPGPRTRTGPTADHLELMTLRQEIQHLNAVIRSLNNDNDRLRRAAGGFGSSDTLSTILASPLGEKAFKKLSTVLHPDAGGDTALFQALESANAKVKGRR